MAIRHRRLGKSAAQREMSMAVLVEGISVVIRCRPIIKVCRAIPAVTSASPTVDIVEIELSASEFEHLWDGSSNDWVLLHVNAKNPQEEPRYMIVNTVTRRALLISDNDLYAEVKSEMLRHGVRIVSNGNGF